jgi:hypothetical protein
LEIDYSNINFIDEVVNDEINYGGETRKNSAVEVSDDDSDKSLDESELQTQRKGKRKLNMDSNANHQNISGEII